MPRNDVTSNFAEGNRSGAQPRWDNKDRMMGGKKSKSSKRNTDNDDTRDSYVSVGRGDRFIPNRANMNLQQAAYAIRAANTKKEDGADLTVNSNFAVSAEYMNEYTSVLSTALLGFDADTTSTSRILGLNDVAPTPKGDVVNNLSILYSVGKEQASKKSSKLLSRHIASAPTRVLDAPEMLDDYYLNLISWGENNVLAVALTQAVYLWNAGSGEIEELCRFDGGNDSYVSSVQWTQKGGSHLALATSTGAVQLWDVEQGKQLRTMDGHIERVGSLSWNNHVLSSGGRDGVIINHDVRVARHNIASMAGHSQEVCGLTWSRDGSTLASGGNDNVLCLWDAARSGANTAPRFTTTDHQAAVKALAWSPHERNLIASGGGTADRCIKLWNSQTGALLNSVDTGSQVSALQWNPFEKELLSAHGYARNHLCLWKYPAMTAVKELESHTARVLNMACSPDGSTVVSAGADETLRFWNVFTQPGKTAKRSADPIGSNKVKVGRVITIR